MSTVASLCAGGCLLILSSSLLCGGWKAENYIFQAPLVNRVLVWILPMQDIHADLEGREEERQSLLSACSGWPHRCTVSMMFAVTWRWASGNPHFMWHSGEIIEIRWDHRGFLWFKYFLISKSAVVLTDHQSPALYLRISVNTNSLSARIPRVDLFIWLKSDWYTLPYTT